MIKILHTGDWHLRHAQYGLVARGDDFEVAALRLIHKAVELKVDVMVNTGDILDNNRPSSRVVNALKRIHNLLVEVNLPMLTITGNHDKTDPNWMDVLDQCHASGLILLDNRTWTHAASGTRFRGLPWMPKEELLASLEAVAGLGKEEEILLLHTPIREFIYPDPSIMSLADLPHGYRAIMLGDIHLPALAQLGDGTQAAFPGSIELCKSDEPLEKSAWLWQATQPAGKLPPPDKVPLETRKVFTLRLDDEADVKKAVSQLRKAAADKPLVFANYARDLNGVSERLQIAAGPEAIVRAREQVDPAAAALLGSGEAEAQTYVKSELGDFVKHFEGPSSPLHEVVSRLALPNVDADIVLDEFIAKELAHA